MITEIKSGYDINSKLLGSIDALQLNERLKGLKERYLNTTPRLASERGTLYAESWRETEGQPIQLRIARAVKKVLENVPTPVFENELVVGSITKHFRGSYAMINYDSNLILELLPESNKGEITMGGLNVIGVLDEETERALIENSKYFKGKTNRDLEDQVCHSIFGSWQDDVTEARGQAPYHYAPPGYGITYYDEVFTKGLKGIIEEVKERLDNAEKTGVEDPEKIWFWQSVIFVSEGLITFARNYANEARRQAEKESDPERQAELEEMARVCEKVPEYPPGDFHEAVQTVSFVELAKVLENGRIGDYIGRLDQCLYPYFKKDVEEGQITIEKAADLVGGLITLIGRREQCAQVLMREAVQTNKISNITIAGMMRDGSDACNELTYLFLHVVSLLRYAEPHFTFTWHDGVPHWAMMKAIETNRITGAGHPQFINGDTTTQYFVNRGVPVEDARDHAYLGCSYAHPKNQGYHCKAISYINMALLLDLALHNGVATMTGKKIGLETGDPRNFRSFDELFEAYRKQAALVVRRFVHRNHVAHRTELSTWRVPLHSTFATGCLDNGYDIMMGGQMDNPADHPVWDVIDRGHVSAADSLTAIKKLVFDDKTLTMSELLDALDSDFEGERGKELQRMCLEAPKYGNDIDEADYMVRDVGKVVPRLLESERTPFGSRYTIIRQGLTWHYYGGKGVGALANGRKAGLPLADASLSPTQGADTNGPTAVCNSALKADFVEAKTAVLNQKFPLSLFKTEGFAEKLADFTETFLRNGGLHIQYNLLDAETLRKAKIHPEEYKDLIVRVAGYSAYFVLLAPEVQDEIIARTEQTL
jgi:pyruvate formate-lyase/glycerol dehydratase family glycyl radical enzyme